MVKLKLIPRGTIWDICLSLALGLLSGLYIVKTAYDAKEQAERGKENEE